MLGFSAASVKIETNRILVHILDCTCSASKLPSETAIRQPSTYNHAPKPCPLDLLTQRRSANPPHSNLPALHRKPQRQPLPDANLPPPELPPSLPRLLRSKIFLQTSMPQKPLFHRQHKTHLLRSRPSSLRDSSTIISKARKRVSVRMQMLWLGNTWKLLSGKLWLGRLTRDRRLRVAWEGISWR